MKRNRSLPSQSTQSTTNNSIRMWMALLLYLITKVVGVILIDLGCEKTNLAQVESYLLKREKPFDKPVAKIGIQDVGGTEAAIQQGLKDVVAMLPAVNETSREEVSVSEL